MKRVTIKTHKLTTKNPPAPRPCSTLDTIINTDTRDLISKSLAKEQVHSAMFDMYCSLPRERKRFHGPESKREDALLKEANR